MKSKTMGWPEDWWVAMNEEAEKRGQNLSEWIRATVAGRLVRNGHKLSRVRTRGEFDHQDKEYRKAVSEGVRASQDWEWIYEE